MPFSRPVAAPAFQSRRVRREDAPGAPVLTGRCVVEDSTHPTTAQTEAASGWTEQHNTSGGGGNLQLAVEARQRQAPADGQLQIGGVIGGKLIVSGQLNDVGKGPAEIISSISTSDMVGSGLSILPTTLRTLHCGSPRVIRTNDDRPRTLPAGNSGCLSSEVVFFS